MMLSQLTQHDLRILAAEYASQRDARPDSWHAMQAHARADVERTPSVTVLPVPCEPYADAQAQADDVHNNGRLYVSTLHCLHPFWSPAENVIFRAFHDLHHIAAQEDFSPRGEWRTFLSTLHTTPLAAQHALLCESIYQLALGHVLGGFPQGLQRCTTLGPYASLLLRTHR